MHSNGQSPKLELGSDALPAHSRQLRKPTSKRRLTMYQHYVTESRVTQHRQQLMSEATIARQVHASRQAGHTTPQPGASGTGSFVTTHLHNLMDKLVAGRTRA